ATLRNGTAIGEAIYRALDAIAIDAGVAPSTPSTHSARPHYENLPPARIVLLSDGATNTGRPNDEAAQAALAAKVSVATIAFGTPHGFLESGGQKDPVPVDADALQKIADTTKGTFYRAASEKQLTAVYRNLGSRLNVVVEQREISRWFVGGALA